MSGGIDIATNLLADSVSYNLARNQQSLQNIAKQLSTGLRINSPSDDPSGYAQATQIQSSIDGYDQASLNIQTANNAAQIATGAISNITGVLQQIRSLAVEATSSLISTNDLNGIQSEISQLVQEVNQISSTTSFNGQNLLDGSISGSVPQTNASATITQNAVLSSNGNSLVASVTYSATDTTITDGTFEALVINDTTNSTISVELFYISSGATGLQGSLVTTIQGGNTSFAYNDVTVSISAVATADIGSVAFIKVLQFVSAGASTIPDVTVQTGPNAGQSINFGIANLTAKSLRIGGLNVLAGTSSYDSLAAEDTVGQVDNAISLALNAQAAVGAATLRLNTESDNNSLAVINLQASKAAIEDLNVSQASSDYTRTQLLISFGTSLLAQANVNAQSVLQLFR